MRGHAHTILGGCVIVLAAAAGCYTGPSTNAGSPSGGTTTESSPTETAGAEAIADLPCDVASVLSTSCSSCHGAALIEGAPNRLLSRADLMAPLGSDPAHTMAELCIARMKHEGRPMPPDVAVSPNAVSVLEKWIAAGMPEGTCAVRAIDYSTESVCTSGTRWTKGNEHGDEEMTPGQPCISCHKQENTREAKIYSVAGTVYPSTHEPDDCYGVRGKAEIIITDATGAEFTVDVNAAGNFMDTRVMKKPFRAKVKRGNAVFEMQGEIKDGDCNGCHTELSRADEGAEYARGRIVLP